MRSNYFLLYHSVNYVSDEDTLLLNFKDKDFDKIAALILTIKVEKLDGYLELEEFKKLCKKIIINGFLNASSLYEFCSIILQRLSTNKDLVDEYMEVFEFLHVENLLTLVEKKKLRSIFESLHEEVLHVDSLSSNFKASKETLLSSLVEMKKLCDSEVIGKDIDTLESYINNQTFSIGITGVMNVGKSTFINSLLSQELLGSSVVAETANLSVIKYSKEAYTKVRFFNSLEFDEMLHSFSDEKEKKEYLSALESSIKIDKYVQKESLTKEIDRKSLKKYTSASDSSGLCHLVKDVELGVDLEFLKDSIEIVDTPGLDDSLIVRESVTQGYVSNCDLLIHLMNVNQSATQKDVDFIIDCVLNQNVTKILILLTKADNITKEEIIEVESYTKSSIENQFTSLGEDFNVSKVLSSLKFLTISAKTALDIRVSSESNEEGLKNSGILDVESYLFDTLFSKNDKNELIIENAKKRLNDIAKAQLKIYSNNLLLYSKDEGALEEELHSFNKTKENMNSTCKLINKEINSEFNSFKESLNKLNTDMGTQLSDLKSKVMMRVIDEIRYTLEKSNVELKETQIKMIVDKSLNHGFIDIVRDHKHKLDSMVINISKNIELSLKKHSIEVGDVENNFSMQELFEKNSNSVLTSSAKMILKETMNLCKSIKLSKIDKFKEDYIGVIDKEFVYVQAHLEATIKELNDSVLDVFFDALRIPIVRLEDELREYESTLESQIFLLRDKDKNIEEIQVNTQDNINSINSLIRSVS
ncbi:dynamin family protein [Sulfurimonas sp.]|nr:dynamin family protein [Sulfurimonas sp.]